MRTKPVIEFPKTRAIKCVGKTAQRRDNFFKTELIWMPNQIHMVEEAHADEFIKYPDIWAECDVATGEVLMDQYVEMCSKAGLPPLLAIEDIVVNTPSEFPEREPPSDMTDEEIDELLKTQKGTLNDAIRTAIDGLDPDNPDHFTTTGKPKVKAIEQIINEAVSADSVKAVWDEMNG